MSSAVPYTFTLPIVVPDNPFSHHTAGAQVPDLSDSACYRPELSSDFHRSQILDFHCMASMTVDLGKTGEHIWPHHGRAVMARFMQVVKTATDSSLAIGCNVLLESNT